MARVTITLQERHELEQALGRLETEQRLLTDELRLGSAQGATSADTRERCDVLDRSTFVEGRIRQLRALLAAAEPVEPGAGAEA